MKRSIAILLLAISFFALGMYIYRPLFMFFEPRVDGISVQVTDFGGLFRTSVLFSLTLALIPVLIAVTWSLGAIVAFTRRFATVLIVLAFISLAIFIRHQSVRSYLTGAANTLPQGSSTPLTYPLDPVNFVYYMFAGLCIGCLVAYFIYRARKS